MGKRSVELAACANLGPKASQMLAAVGITSLSQLKRMGAVAAYAKVKKTGLNASLNLLWALEGAITDTHWRIVARESRMRLLLALDDRRSRSRC
jgi:DNA transformation protein and related proteins